MEGGGSYIVEMSPWRVGLAGCVFIVGGGGHCVVSECSLDRNRQKRVILYEPCMVMTKFESATGCADACETNVTET
jgi:hypothetical protein